MSSRGKEDACWVDMNHECPPLPILVMHAGIRGPKWGPQAQLQAPPIQRLPSLIPLLVCNGLILSLPNTSPRGQAPSICQEIPMHTYPHLAG